jgi:cytoskeletal protein RodZ
MSKTGKIILWVVIAVIVIGGIWWWWVASQSAAPAMAPAMNGTSTGANMAAASGTPASASTSYPQGDSDQSINQDMTNLNAQMNGLNSDNASVTQSMNDQPVQQAE